MVRHYETAENILRELWENVAKAAKFALADGVEFVMQKAWARCPVYKGKNIQGWHGNSYRLTIGTG